MKLWPRFWSQRKLQQTTRKHDLVDEQGFLKNKIQICNLKKELTNFPKTINKIRWIYTKKRKIPQCSQLFYVKKAIQFVDKINTVDEHFLLWSLEIGVTRMGYIYDQLANLWNSSLLRKPHLDGLLFFKESPYGYRSGIWTLDPCISKNQRTNLINPLVLWLFFWG
jgi:hypothetical protein